MISRISLVPSALHVNVVLAGGRFVLLLHGRLERGKRVSSRRRHQEDLPRPRRNATRLHRRQVRRLRLQPGQLGVVYSPVS